MPQSCKFIQMTWRLTTNHNLIIHSTDFHLQQHFREREKALFAHAIEVVDKKMPRRSLET